MKVLLIPSAELIPREMRIQMGSLPTCLFPLQDEAMLERLYKKYANYVDRMYVVVNRGKEKVAEYIKLKQIPVELITVNELRDLGYTVFYGLRDILKGNANIECLYINFADTLLSNHPDEKPKDTIFYASEVMAPDWTFFQQTSGVLHDIVDKRQPADAEAVSIGKVFTGVFVIAHIADFLQKLSEALIHRGDSCDSFYSALTMYSVLHPFEFDLSEKWFDVGHHDRYLQAKTNVAARSFNSIEVDNKRGVLTKRSDNREKLIDEIKWYLKIPEDLQYLLPRVYRYSLNWSDPYISMEYYGYNTLHEMLVYGDISGARWQKIFHQLFFVVEDMGRFQARGDPDGQRHAMMEMYITKTIARLEKLRNDYHFSRFFQCNCVINKKNYPALDAYIRTLPSLIEKRLIDPYDDSFCIIHGDLCFSNILVESGRCFLKTVDPRGRFGSYDIYGDRRYELAKLMHSMDGQYDYLTEDMFSIQVNDCNIVLDIPQKTKKIYQMFKSEFCELLSNYENLKLIESLLFLSMIPLHKDVPTRQYAMFATGLRLLDEATGGDRTWISAN